VTIHSNIDTGAVLRTTLVLGAATVFTGSVSSGTGPAGDLALALGVLAIAASSVRLLAHVYGRRVGLAVAGLFVAAAVVGVALATLS